MRLTGGSFNLIITFIFVNTVEYRKIATDATKLVNVRNAHKLQYRSLLFPPTAPTRVQFIGGIGIPVEDLRFESVTSGYVLKALYFLPETTDVFRQKIKPQNINRRRKSVNETTSGFDREQFNNVRRLNQLNSNIFKNETLNLPENAISDSHKPPLQPSNNNFENKQTHLDSYRWIVYKAIEVILDKSSLNGHACLLRSICEHAVLPLSSEGGLLAEILHIILTPSTSRDQSRMFNTQSYIKAETLGYNGENCEKIFSNCIKSPMEIISAVFET